MYNVNKYFMREEKIMTRNYNLNSNMMMYIMQMRRMYFCRDKIVHPKS